MSSQELLLSWDNHYETLVDVFGKLLESDGLVDCTIAADGQQLKAHKVVLSSFSPFLEMIFKEQSEKNPTIILSGISFQELKYLMDFMYRGKVRIFEDKVGSLIDAAQSLQIKGLGFSNKDSVHKNSCGNLFSSREHKVLSNTPKKRRKSNSKVADYISSKRANIVIERTISEKSMDLLSVKCQIPSPLRPSTNICSEDLNDSNLNSCHVQSRNSGNSDTIPKPVELALGDPDSVLEEFQSEKDNALVPKTFEEVVLSNSPRYLCGNADQDCIFAVSQDIVVRNVNLPEQTAVKAERRSEVGTHLQDSEYLQENLNFGHREEVVEASMNMTSQEEDNMNENFGSQVLGVTGLCTEVATLHGNQWQEQCLVTVDIQSPDICEEVIGTQEGAAGRFTCDPSLRTRRRRSQSGLTVLKKRHCCPVCGKTFPWLSSLKMHLLVHSGVKPFKCNECSYSAARRGTLNIHKRIHSGEKSFKCTMCEFASAYLSALKRHEERQHP